VGNLGTIKGNNICMPDEHHLRAEVDRANRHIMPGPAMAIHCP
jgi:hypothetical protein